jgi:hypothetical protein
MKDFCLAGAVSHRSFYVCGFFSSREAQHDVPARVRSDPLRVR